MVATSKLFADKVAESQNILTVILTVKELLLQIMIS